MRRLPVSVPTFKDCIGLVEYWTLRYFARLVTYTDDKFVWNEC